MALAAGEAWRGGFVVDTTTGTWATTTNPAGTAWQGGFKRDPDGRILVSTTMPGNPVIHNGLPFDPTSGALLISGGSSAANPVNNAGAWSGTAAYAANDLVTYGGKSYIAKSAIAAGTAQAIVVPSGWAEGASKIKQQAAGAVSRTITDLDVLTSTATYRGATYRGHLIQITALNAGNIDVSMDVQWFDVLNSAATRVAGIASTYQIAATAGSRWYVMAVAGGDSTPPLDAPQPYTLTIAGSLQGVPNDPPTVDTTRWDALAGQRMALAAGEYWSGGLVLAADGSLATTTTLTGATWWGGFLRDPDGRLVVVYFP